VNWHRAVVNLFALAATIPPQAVGQSLPDAPDRVDLRTVLKWSEPDQIAGIRWYLNRGLPPSDVWSVLMLSKESIALPLVEEKIEQVLAAPSRMDCFTDKSVNPEKFVFLATSVITYAGDEEALRQISKLIKIDAIRFAPSVGETLQEAEIRAGGNPFLLAYRGFDIGNTSVHGAIGSWAELELGDKMPALRQGDKVLRWDPVPEYRSGEVRNWWAQAMILRYGGVPTGDEWDHDPIASRLTGSLRTSLYADVIRRASELLAKR